MKFVCFLFAALFAATSAFSEETLRAGSYNVEFGKNASAEEIGAMFKAYNLDLVGFNEVPDGDWTARAAREMGMKYVYVGTVSSANHKDKYKSIASRYPLTDCREIELNAPGGWNPASAVGAAVEINGKKISFYSTHICFNKNENDHARQIVEDLIKSDKNELILVAGDFNCKVDHTSGIRHFYDSGFRSCWLERGIDTAGLFTWNALNLKENLGVIDQIVLRGKAEFTQAEIIELEKPLSDHKPIWCEIKF